MREDLHVPPWQSAEQEEDAYVENLIRQHRERLDQITRYYRTGRMTAEQVKNILEGTPPKKG